MELNNTSLDTLCGALAYGMGIEPPKEAAEKNETLSAYLDEKLQGEKLDRLFMYNPDAIGQWVFEKYPHLMKEVTERTELQVPFCTVMPSVTPVCFATMYTGVQPEVHGIRKYQKPVLTQETLFDTLIKAGKKVAILASPACSIGMIFLERELDYFLFKTYEEINAKAAELILKDEYDVIVVYNGNYDSVMHKKGPESIEALGELRCNSRTFGTFERLIAEHWQNHRTLLGFAMDHGCHEIDDDCGSHGLDMPEDLNITHFYKVL